MASARNNPRQEITWPMAIVGTILALVLAERTLEAYFGPLASRLIALLPTPVAQQQLSPDEAAADTIFFTRQTRAPAVGGQVLDSSATPAQLNEGALVLDGSGELVRLGKDGTRTGLVGQAGQKVRIANLGAWDAPSRRLTGLDAVYQSGRWVIPADGIQPSNPNGRLQLHDAGLPAQFWVSPGDAHYKIVWNQDSQGAFAHIQAAGPNAYLVLNSSVPLNDLDDVPITVRGMVRTSCSCGSRLTVYDVTSADGQAQTYTQESRQKNSWTILTLTVPRVKYPNDGDNFSLGLFALGPNDWFDVRELSLFEGVVP